MVFNVVAALTRPRTPIPSHPDRQRRAPPLQTRGSTMAAAHSGETVLARVGAREGHLEGARVTGGVLEVHRKLHSVLSYRVAIGVPRVLPTARACIKREHRFGAQLQGKPNR